MKRLTKQLFVTIVAHELPHLDVKLSEYYVKGRSHGKIRFSDGHSYNQVDVRNPNIKFPDPDPDYFSWNEYYTTKDALKYLKDRNVDLKKYGLER